MHRFRYLFIDFNAYFASVEQHDDPTLQGRPVLVAPLKSEHTSAIAVSYEARRFNVHRGTSIREARTLCPEIAIRYARHDRYVVVHRQIMKELDRHLPLEKVYSIDEAAFRLGSGEQTEAAAHAMAQQIKNGLSNNVGPALRSSIGISASPLLAKLAAESKKPDGITILPLTDLPHRFKDMPLRNIPGVGAGVEARLQRANIKSFLDLWNIAPKQARAIWGSVQGERFWYQLHGYETKEPLPDKSMIGHSRVLTKGHEAPDEARIVARALLLKAASRLRHYRLFASSLSLSVKQRGSDGRSRGRTDFVARFSPAQDSYLFLEKLHTLWDEAMAQFASTSGGIYCQLRLAGVTVYLHGLCQEGDDKYAQGDFFDNFEEREKISRRAKLWHIIDSLNADPKGRLARLGRSKADSQTGKNKSLDTDQNIKPLRRHVTLVRQQGLDLNYLGSKIAFSRVPEEVEFLF